jgi:hypothetical protein
MLPFFGSAAITIAALTSTPAPAGPAVAQAAPVTAPVTATAPSRRGRHSRQAATVQNSTPDSDAAALAAALEEQNRMRVLFPALSGDGGG